MLISQCVLSKKLKWIENVRVTKKNKRMIHALGSSPLQLGSGLANFGAVIAKPKYKETINDTAVPNISQFDILQTRFARPGDPVYFRRRIASFGVEMVE